MKLTLYSKPDCHLCSDALRELEGLRTRQSYDLVVVDITSDAALLERYGERIPVLDNGLREYDAPLGRGTLERALREAAAHG